MFKFPFILRSRYEAEMAAERVRLDKIALTTRQSLYVMLENKENEIRHLRFERDQIADECNVFRAHRARANENLRRANEERREKAKERANG